LKGNWNFGETRRLHFQVRRMLLANCFMDYSPILKMEATCYSETSVNPQGTTRRYILEDRNLPNIRCQNHKFYISSWFIPRNILIRINAHTRYRVCVRIYTHLDWNPPKNTLEPTWRTAPAENTRTRRSRCKDFPLISTFDRVIVAASRNAVVTAASIVSRSIAMWCSQLAVCSGRPYGQYSCMQGEFQFSLVFNTN
jgi:hypothetical protein